ncbi:MAG: hypothetical protein NXI31_03145 [bacterium]|nr:hypothetical protein [bacterium]
MKIKFSVVLTALSASALAQTTVYSNAAPRATATVIAGSNAGAPSLRYWGGSASDGTRMFVFGGRSVSSAGTAGSVYYNGLDTYDPGTNTWTNLSLDGAAAAPSNRFRMGMAFDPNNNRIVVFGGRASATGTVFSDCHAFDLGSNTWSSIANPTPGTTGPTARFDTKMAFDASSGTIVLFGGQGPSGSTNRFGDTWVLTGTTWAAATPAVSPSARAIHAMTARSAPYGDVVVISGRDAANARLDDTWRWDSTAGNWVQINPIGSTVPVTFGGGNEAVYDAARQVVTILLGPGTGTAPSNTTGAGGWTSEYDCVTNEWRAFGNNLTSQTSDDPLLGRQQRFYAAYVAGKTYFWCGQNAPSVGDANLPFVKEYQASPLSVAPVLGAGCTGSGGAMTLVANDAPWTGRTWTLTGTGFAATGLGAILIGLGTQSTPLNTLHPAGGAGCNVLVTTDATALLFPAAGQASYSLTLPYDPAFAGLPLNGQMIGVELDVSSNITLITSTNGIGGVVGAL